MQGGKDMKEKREYAFDLLRVISMFMVIVVHVSNVYSRSYGIISNQNFLFSLIYNTISRISVPIFLMISGALLLDRKFDKTKYRKRIMKFLILIIIWDIIYLVWEYFYLGNTYEPLYRLLIEPYRAHLWFLYTIIILYLLQPLMKIIMDKSNKVVKILLLIIWFTCGAISMMNPRIGEYFTFVSYAGFFIVGKYLYDYVKKYVTPKHNLVEIIVIVVCIILSIILNYKASLKYDMFYNFFFAYRTPMITFASFAFYAFIITNYQKESIGKVLSTLSEVSLGVYLIHGIFLDIVVRTIPHYSLNPLFAIPVFSILIFIASVGSVYLLRKIKILQKIF